MLKACVNNVNNICFYLHVHLIAFAFNAKYFAIAILVFFYFFLTRPVFWMDCQKFSGNISRLVVKKVCDQDLGRSLDTAKNISAKIVPQVVIRDTCGT